MLLCVSRLVEGAIEFLSATAGKKTARSHWSAARINVEAE